MARAPRSCRRALRLCLRLYGNRSARAPAPSPARRARRRRQALAVVLILPGAGGGGGGGDPAPAPWPDPAGSAPPAPTPRRAPRPPAAAPARARLPAAPCARQPCCSCPRCWRSWLTVRDPGVRRRTVAGARSRGRTGRALWRSAPRVRVSNPSSESCRLRSPGAGRAGRGAGSAGAKLPRLPPFAPSRDLAFNRLPGSNGILCCNSSRHPLPAHKRSAARHLATLRASGAQRRGRGDAAASRDGLAGGGRSRLPRRPPNFARLCRGSRGLSHLDCGGSRPAAVRSRG